VFANGVTTITVDDTHYLLSGDLVTVRFKNAPQLLTDIPVTVTSATSFSVITVNDDRIQEDGEIEIGYYSAGQTGSMQSITLSNTTGAAAVLQSFVTGVGGAAYTVYGSLDNLHWTPDSAGLITHAAVNDDTQFAIIAPAWLWIKVVLTSVGAGTKLTIHLSS
jgi:hypothetical protein